MPSAPEPRAYRMGARAESAALTRERVLDAAAACFGEQDYDAVSLREIAERAGVGLQTVVRTAAKIRTRDGSTRLSAPKSCSGRTGASGKVRLVSRARR